MPSRNWLAGATLIGCVGVLASYRSFRRDSDATIDLPAGVNSPAPLAQSDPHEAAAAQRRACGQMRSQLESAPEWSGAPELEKQRTEVLGRAKGSPVLFLRKPERDVEAIPAFARHVAAQLDDPRTAMAAINQLRAWLPFHMPLVRAALLPNGYLYSESADVADWLVTIFRPEHLFNEPELWMLRGSQIVRLVKTKSAYEFAEGPDKGREASLLLFDRLATSPGALIPALHLDLLPLNRELGFDRVRVERITAEGLTVQLRYGSDQVWTRAAIVADGPRARLLCETSDESAALETAIASYRAKRRERDRIVDTLRTTAMQFADENLPFDEPREEVGQQDGSLRPRWAWAYAHGSSGYSFNDLGYGVFDTKGRPHPPQVCIDFVLDTYERASGTWYRDRTGPRERVVGGIDFEKLEIPNRRGVESVVTFFREHPDMFEVWDLPATDRVPFRDTKSFMAYLAEHADEFLPPDVVVIHGPKGAENHYHSFFVYESDPVTGMPVLLAGNAGRPRIRSWSGVMSNAPLRSIKHRLRPRMDWLSSVLAAKAPIP